MLPTVGLTLARPIRGELWRFIEKQRKAKWISYQYQRLSSTEWTHRCRKSCK